MKKLIALVWVVVCVFSIIGCNNTTKDLQELETWISDEWSLITDFKILHIQVDTINEPQHSQNLVMIKSSYVHDNESVLRTFTFEISYDEFLTLYNNNGHIVYNIEKESGDIVTGINSESLGILKKVFERNWRTLTAAALSNC